MSYHTKSQPQHDHKQSAKQEEVPTRLRQVSQPAITVFLRLVGAPALLLASFALLGGYLFARGLRQSVRDARTVAIETGIQNGGTAMLVTGTILNSPTMIIAPAMYGVLVFVPVTTYVIGINLFRSRRSTRSTPSTDDPTRGFRPSRQS